MKGFRFLGVGGNRTGVPGENLPRRAWNRQTKLTYNHWLAALVKGKCSSTKPTRLATGVMCHHDTEQNRPYKIRPCPCRGLNRGSTVPQTRTLPVCHTTPFRGKTLKWIQDFLFGHEQCVAVDGTTLQLVTSYIRCTARLRPRTNTLLGLH